MYKEIQIKMKIKINIQSKAQKAKKNIQMNRLYGWARIAVDGMMERAPVRIPQSKTLINTDENTNSKTHNQTLFLGAFHNVQK